MKACMKAMGLFLVFSAIGCGEITAEDTPDAGGTGGATIDAPGTGGRTDPGVGGRIAGVGGAPQPGTGGMPAMSYPFCEPTEVLTVDTATCQKLQPGGTYKNSTRDGYVCASCSPPATGMPIANLPCVYNNRLCTHDCTTECN